MGVDVFQFDIEDSVFQVVGVGGIVGYVLDYGKLCGLWENVVSISYVNYVDKLFFVVGFLV